MSTNPQAALPWAQTLAGLFGGFVNARQQAINNPRQGFSILPVLSGGFEGLSRGLGTQAARAELLRQEGRDTNDALGWLAATTGQSADQIRARFDGNLPKQYRQDAAERLQTGLGQQYVAQQLGVENPEGWQNVGATLGNSILPAVQQQIGNEQALSDMPRLRAAGYNDAGGQGTPNEIPLWQPPTLSSLMPGLGSQGNAVGAPPTPGMAMVRSASASAGSNPIRAGNGGVGQPSQMQPLIGNFGTSSPTPMAVAQTMGGDVQLDTSEQPLTASAMATRPRTLAELARAGSNPTALLDAYKAASTAANYGNTQVTQRYNAAQQVGSQNERAVLDYNKPSTAWILANGSPEQKAALQDYQETQVRRAAAMYGLDKPATRGEINADYTDIRAARNATAAAGAIKKAVEAGTMTQAQGEEYWNSTRRGQRDPIGGADQQTQMPAPFGLNMLPNLDLIPPQSTPGSGVPSANVSGLRRYVIDRNGLRSGFPRN